MEVGEEAVGPFTGGGDSGGVQFGNGVSFTASTRLRRWNEQWTSKTKINVSRGLHLHLFYCVALKQTLTDLIDSFTRVLDSTKVLMIMCREFLFEILFNSISWHLGCYFRLHFTSSIGWMTTSQSSVVV